MRISMLVQSFYVPKKIEKQDLAVAKYKSALNRNYLHSLAFYTGFVRITQSWDLILFAQSWAIVYVALLLIVVKCTHHVGKRQVCHCPLFDRLVSK
jgi:hypothetical protein